MAVKAKKVKGVDKWRKKKYYSILAPKLFQERELGQTIAYDPSSLKGRRVTTNLMALTGNIKKQHVNMTFAVERVQGDTGFTRVHQYTVVPAALKRKVRRQRDRIDESFQCVTKDNKIIRIKPLVVTAVKTSRSVKSDLRNKLLQLVINAVRKLDYDSLVMDIVNDKFQRDIAGYIRKIVPTRSVDIRVMKYIGEQKGVTVEKPAEEKVEEKPAEVPKKEEAKKPEPAEEVSETQSVSDDDQKSKTSKEVLGHENPEDFHKAELSDKTKTE